MLIRIMIPNKIKRENIESIFVFLCISTYFKPGCIDNFITYNINYATNEFIADLFTVSKLFVSILAVTLIIAKMIVTNDRRIFHTVLFVPFLISSSFVTASNIYNHSGIGSVLVGLYEIGFVCLCELLLEKGEDYFIHTFLSFFFIYSLIGAFSILFFPNGFNHVNDIHYAIYFLGSKNAAVNPYLIFLLTYLGSEYLKNGALPVKGLIYAIFFLYTGFVMESSSTIISLGILIIFYIVYGVLKCERIIRPWISYVIAVITILFAYLGSALPQIVKILSYFGRNITFSGRTILWRQAIDCFFNSPVFGKGSLITFNNFSGVIQNGAHSQYLDRLAKFGIITLSGMVVAFSLVEWRLITSSRKKMASLLGTIFSIFIFRIGFDSYNYCYIIVICYCIISLINQSEKKYIRYRRELSSRCRGKGIM